MAWWEIKRAAGKAGRAAGRFYREIRSHEAEAKKEKKITKKEIKLLKEADEALDALESDTKTLGEVIDGIRAHFDRDVKHYDDLRKRALKFKLVSKAGKLEGELLTLIKQVETELNRFDHDIIELNRRGNLDQDAINEIYRKLYAACNKYLADKGVAIPREGGINSPMELGRALGMPSYKAVRRNLIHLENTVEETLRAYERQKGLFERHSNELRNVALRIRREADTLEGELQQSKWNNVKAVLRDIAALFKKQKGLEDELKKIIENLEKLLVEFFEEEDWSEEFERKIGGEMKKIDLLKNVGRGVPIGQQYDFRTIRGGGAGRVAQGQPAGRQPRVAAPAQTGIQSTGGRPSRGRPPQQGRAQQP